MSRRFSGVVGRGRPGLFPSGPADQDFGGLLRQGQNHANAVLGPIAAAGVKLMGWSKLFAKGEPHLCPDSFRILGRALREPVAGGL